MMPGVGFAEMVVLVLVAIVVIGPKDLPLMMRKFGRFTGKMRAMAFEFQQGFEELGRQAELEELRREVADLKRHTGMEEFTREMEKDRADMERDLREAASEEEASPVSSVSPPTSPGALPGGLIGQPPPEDAIEPLPPEALAALEARLEDFHDGEAHGPPVTPANATPRETTDRQGALA